MRNSSRHSGLNTMRFIAREWPMNVNDAVTKAIDFVGKTFELTLKAILVLTFLTGGYLVYNASMSHFDDGSGGGAYITAIFGVLYLGIGGSLFSALWDRLNDS